MKVRGGWCEPILVSGRTYIVSLSDLYWSASRPILVHPLTNIGSHRILVVLDVGLLFLLGADGLRLRELLRVLSKCLLLASNPTLQLFDVISGWQLFGLYSSLTKWHA